MINDYFRDSVITTERNVLARTVSKIDKEQT